MSETVSSDEKQLDVRDHGLTMVVHWGQKDILLDLDRTIKECSDAHSMNELLHDRKNTSSIMCSYYSPSYGYQEESTL